MTFLYLTHQMMQEAAESTIAATNEGFDPIRLFTDFPGLLADTWPWMLTKAAVLLGTVLAFWVLSRTAKALVRRTVDHESVRGTQLLEDTIVSLTGKIVLVFGVVLGLSFVGVQMGPVLAGLGIVGFVLGFALQDSLANFAAGAMILVYSPFDIGDSVDVAGVVGKVSGMSLVSTTILTSDNQRIIVPNSKIWGNVIKILHREKAPTG